MMLMSTFSAKCATRIHCALMHTFAQRLPQKSLDRIDKRYERFNVMCTHMRLCNITEYIRRK